MASHKNKAAARDALAASGVGLWVWNPAKNIINLDDCSAKLFAAQPGPMPFDQLRSYVHPDDQESVFALMTEIAEDPEQFEAAGSVQAQHRMVLPNGEPIWIQVDAATWRSDGQYLVGGTFKEVTDLRRSIDALRDSEGQFRLYTSLASDYIYEVDPDSKPPMPSVLTGSFEHTTGMTLDEVRERGGWRAVIHPDDQPPLTKFAAAMRAGIGGQLEYRVVAKDGSYRWLRDQVAPVVENGKLVKFVGAVMDITAHKRLDRSEAATQKNQALARFSANAARDFDNLLTVILGAVELASSDEPENPDMTRHLLDTIRSAAEQASELTRGMLLYGQRISGRPTRIEVGTVVGKATAVLRQGLGRQHMLNIEVRDTPVHVLIDPAQLKLMLLNLVVNARHAMPTGGQVTLTVAQHYFDNEHPPPTDLGHGSFVTIEVHDNGVGIPAETLPHIFEPFFTTRLPGEGAGLGLAACRGIVTSAGGTITADSLSEGGAKFTLYLPVDAPSAELEEPESRLEVVLGQDESVLVVDDDPMLQRVFKRVLEEFGFTVDTCGSGEAALAALEEHIFDIVVTDIVMPGIDGVELARTVRRRWQDIPVLLMSGKSHDVDEFEALTKPIRPRELALKIREVLDA